MAQRPNEAVLHCTVKQINKLINLVFKVANALATNVAKYPTPSPTVDDLKLEVETLSNLQADAKNGGKEATAARDQQAIKVFGMLRAELLYVNSVAQGNKDTLLLSGFDINEQPSPHAVPAKVAIKRTEPGPVEHSQKVYLSDNGSPIQITKQAFSYHVEITTDPSSEANWDDAELADGKIGITGNSRGITVVHLVRKTGYHVRVAAINSAGTGEWSDPSPFVAQ